MSTKLSFKEAALATLAWAHVGRALGTTSLRLVTNPVYLFLRFCWTFIGGRQPVTSHGTMAAFQVHSQALPPRKMSACQESCIASRLAKIYDHLSSSNWVTKTCSVPAHQHTAQHKSQSAQAAAVGSLSMHSCFFRPALVIN